METKIYLASWFGSQHRLREEANKLKELGYVITSTWLDEQVAKPEKAEIAHFSPDELLEIAKRDVIEVDNSDILILDTQDETPRGGREVEFGMALATGTYTILVGPIRNVFHYIADYHANTWEEVYECLRDLQFRWTE